MNCLIDTNIILDFLLGSKNNLKSAKDFFKATLSCKHNLFLCEPVMFELKAHGFDKDAEELIFQLMRKKNKIRFIEETTEEINQAKDIIKNTNLPFNDALISILAKKADAIIVTRDKHFLELRQIADSFKPEDLC